MPSLISLQLFQQLVQKSNWTKYKNQNCLLGTVVSKTFCLLTFYTVRVTSQNLLKRLIRLKFNPRWYIHVLVLRNHIFRLRMIDFVLITFFSALDRLTGGIFLCIKLFVALKSVRKIITCFTWLSAKNMPPLTTNFSTVVVKL